MDAGREDAAQGIRELRRIDPRREEKVEPRRVEEGGARPLDLSVLRLDHPGQLLQRVDDLVQRVGGAGILGVDGVVDVAQSVDGRVDACGDQINHLGGVRLVGRELGQAGGRGDGVGAVVGNGVEGPHPLGESCRWPHERRRPPRRAATCRSRKLVPTSSSGPTCPGCAARPGRLGRAAGWRPAQVTPGSCAPRPHDGGLSSQ
jgi:hypothetical protein